MEDSILLSDENVPPAYLCDPMPEVQVEYGIRLYSKSVPDEKEIAQVYFSCLPRDIRIGWMIPVLSIVSLEHELSDNKYFKKHVYEAMKHLKDQELHESIYILVYSKRLIQQTGINQDGEIALAFLLYGIYPFYDKHSLNRIEFKIPVDSKIVISNCFNIDHAIGFFQILVTTVLPSERNDYARFMLLYQVYELAMELIFYKKINELKIKRSHLGIIRKRIDDYSSENKLIGLLYSEMKREENDPNLAGVAKFIFDDVKDESYYASTNKSAMLYDIRNTLVHSYYRFNVSDKLAYLASYIEDEVFYVLHYLHSVEEMKTEIEKNYFNAT